MLALYGLKWNPFAPAVPATALHVTTRLESFCWRVQQLVGEGGFALVTGAPGIGKSTVLRILAASLATQRDVKLGVISRPQANIADFYREMGELFGADLDSRILLTIVLAGDGRLADRLRSDEFLPLASRVRVRLTIERATPQDLQDCLRHALQQAGAPTLMTPEVIATLCDHAQGNPRALMIMAGELLAAAVQREAHQIDEALFFETCAVATAGDTRPAIRRRR